MLLEMTHLTPRALRSLASLPHPKVPQHVLFYTSVWRLISIFFTTLSCFLCLRVIAFPSVPQTSIFLFILKVASNSEDVANWKVLNNSCFMDSLNCPLQGKFVILIYHEKIGHKSEALGRTPHPRYGCWPSVWPSIIFICSPWMETQHPSQPHWLHLLDSSLLNFPQLGTSASAGPSLPSAMTMFPQFWVYQHLIFDSELNTIQLKLRSAEYTLSSFSPSVSGVKFCL